MRVLQTELAARLATGVTTLCTVWRVERADGEVFGFTDHDLPLDLDGVQYAPAAGFSAGAIEKSADLAVDTASAAAALSSDAITEGDLARGLWDGARVDVWRVDWSTPNLKYHVFAGRIGEARRGAQAFEAELRGLQAPLNTPRGRVFSRYCDADVGDGRCDVNLAAPSFHGAGAVSEVLSARAFTATGLAAFADGWFSEGRISWGLGGVADVAVHRQAGTLATIELLDVSAGLQVGAAFDISAGCDKRLETCRTKFANSLNFRGFPHMPGNDALQAGPITGDANDGASRN